MTVIQNAQRRASARWPVSLLGVVLTATGCNGDKADSGPPSGLLAGVVLPGDCTTYVPGDFAYDRRFVDSTYRGHCTPDGRIDPSQDARNDRARVEGGSCEDAFFLHFDACDAASCIQLLKEEALASMEPGPGDCDGLRYPDVCMRQTRILDVYCLHNDDYFQED